MTLRSDGRRIIPAPGAARTGATIDRHQPERAIGVAAGAGEAGDRFEIEGFITRFDSAADFDVEGVPVTTNGQTAFENGSSADLGLNRKVEVEGELDASGVVVADEIELKQASSIRIASGR
ncbi:MAG TPA: DUF5666 domain-containing protein [Woeseiaceae bacterium]|nr:DUF5666 domain-containing protein [Woeseiaceae bacterium]